MKKIFCALISMVIIFGCLTASAETEKNNYCEVIENERVCKEDSTGKGGTPIEEFLSESPDSDFHVVQYEEPWELVSVEPYDEFEELYVEQPWPVVEIDPETEVYYEVFEPIYPVWPFVWPFHIWEHIHWELIPVPSPIFLDFVAK